MKRKFSEPEIDRILDRSSDLTVTEVCKKHGIHRRTFYKWRAERLGVIKQAQPQDESKKMRKNATEKCFRIFSQITKNRPNAKPFEIVRVLIEAHSLPVAKACRLGGITRSMWYRNKPVTIMTVPLARECRRLVHRMAKKYAVPAACITAHTRGRDIEKARKEVWRIMLSKMKMSPKLVAESFGRDRRRLRASVVESRSIHNSKDAR